MRRSLVVTGVLVVLLVAAAIAVVAYNNTQPAAGGTKTTYPAVTVRLTRTSHGVYKAFPQTIKVHVGQGVVFSNSTDHRETVTARTGQPPLFNSGPIPPRDSWHYSPDKAGRFKWYSKIHPGLHGTLVVRPAGQG